MFRKDRPKNYIPRGITLNPQKPKHSFFVWNKHRAKSVEHGVYVFYDKEGSVVYVGKADNLKKRAVYEHLSGNGEESFENFFFCELYEIPYPDHLSIELAWISMMRPPLCKEIGLKHDYLINNRKNLLTKYEKFALEHSFKLKGINPRHVVVLMAMVKHGDYDDLLDLENEDAEKRVLKYLKAIKWKDKNSKERDEIITIFKRGLLQRLQYEDYSEFENTIKKVAHEINADNDSLIFTSPLEMYNGTSMDDYKKLVEKLNL